MPRPMQMYFIFWFLLLWTLMLLLLLLHHIAAGVVTKFNSIYCTQWQKYFSTIKQILNTMARYFGGVCLLLLLITHQFHKSA